MKLTALLTALFAVFAVPALACSGYTHSTASETVAELPPLLPTPAPSTGS